MSGTPRRKPGRLGPFVEGYRVRLLELGYTPQTVRAMLKVLGQLGRWMDDEGVEPGRLNMAAVEAFLACRRAGGDRRVASLGGAAAEGGDAGMAWLRGGALGEAGEAARGVRWHGVAAVELERGEMDGSGMRAVKSH